MSRPGLLLSVCVVAATTSGLAHAEDARVTFLSKQLAGAKDARVRAQTLLALGQTGSDDAVPVLCGAMKDGESVVRSAAASALAELRTAASITCLKSVKETDPGVKAAIDKGIAAGAIEAGALYLSVDPVQDKVGDLPSDLLKLADQTMRDQLNSYGATFAPVNEDKKSAATLIGKKKLKGFLLRMQLLPGASDKGLKVEMLIMTYPEQALKGSWNVKAAGGKPESLIKKMVPKVVDDAALDLEWKK